MDMKNRKEDFISSLKKEIENMNNHLKKLRKLIDKVGKSVLFTDDEVNRAVFVLLVIKFTTLDENIDVHTEVLKAIESGNINELFAELDEKIKDLFDEDDEGIDISKMS